MIEVIKIKQINIKCSINDIYSKITYKLIIKENKNTIINKTITNNENNIIELEDNKIYSISITPSLSVYPYKINDTINTYKDLKTLNYNFGIPINNKETSIVLNIIDANYENLILERGEINLWKKHT